MTLAEFKAWFEGYTESMDGAPSKKQFERIKEKVSAINGAPITQTVYVRDYWNDYYRRYTNWPYGASGGFVGMSAAVPMNGLSASYASSEMGQATGGGTPFDSHAAMFALGKADALAA